MLHGNLPTDQPIISGTQSKAELSQSKSGSNAAKPQRCRSADHTEAMPKINTAKRRKTIEAEAPKPKRRRSLKNFHCSMCNRTFGQKVNYLRHLGLVHHRAEDGQPITDQAYARLAAYNRRSTIKKTIGNLDLSWKEMWRLSQRTCRSV